MMQEFNLKYGNLETGTRIFFKGDHKDASCLGTIILEVSEGYMIEMDNGRSFIVHPLEFENFGGLFQVVEEREAKLSYLNLN